MPKPLAERFWSKVQKTETCWLWTGALMSKGYGCIQYGDRRNHAVLASRVSWELHNGPIPDGLWVLHTCDTPRCVRPDHLYLGTVAENTRDMWSRDRQKLPTRQPTPAERARGSRSGPARLTEEQVIQIRERYGPAKGRGGRSIYGVSQAALAAEFGIDQTIISDIVRRENWKHLP